MSDVTDVFIEHVSKDLMASETANHSFPTWPTCEKRRVRISGFNSPRSAILSHPGRWLFGRFLVLGILGWPWNLTSQEMPIPPLYPCGTRNGTRSVAVSCCAPKPRFPSGPRTRTTDTISPDFKTFAFSLSVVSRRAEHHLKPHTHDSIMKEKGGQRRGSERREGGLHGSYRYPGKRHP